MKPLVPILFAIGLLVGCSKTAICRPGTIYVTLSLDASAAAATNFAIEMSVGSTDLFTTTIAHAPGQQNGVLRIDPPEAYVAGEALTLIIRALGPDGEIASATTGPTPLMPVCTSLAMSVVTETSTFDGGADLPFEIADMSTVVQDLTLTPGPDIAGSVGLALSHLPQHYLTDGTCDLTVNVSINTTTLKVDGLDVPAGCVFVTDTDGGGLAVAVMAVHSLTIPGGQSVVVSGNRPLVVAAATTISIAGTLDGSAKTTTPGPGGGPSGGGLGAGGAGTHSGQYSDSGGGGGGYGTAGAVGGTGNYMGMIANPAAASSPYGTSNLVTSAPGGSGGGHGSSEACNSMNGGTGGAGGGSIQLSAKSSITLAGATINAGGGGGSGGCLAGPADQGSGGGGGSGGAIFLESPIVMASSSGMWANGGSGGGGASGGGTSGGNGSNGAASQTAAPGGLSGGTNGGAGGNGSAVGAPTKGADQAAGGGGGGAAGRIVIRSRGAASLMTTTISPAPVLDTSIP